MAWTRGDDGWLTLSEIARRLGRSLSTVTSRRTTWRGHLDERRGQDGHLRYRLDAFAEMARLMAANADHSQIRQALDVLREQPPALGAVLDPIQDIADRLTRLEDAVSATRALLARIADHLGVPED